ncbi:MAG: Uroporphyrinogen-III synthase [Nitrospira sp.]|nr:MAG: Uroporphyrinogen-III synthase [Nitrospira sp.]
MSEKGFAGIAVAAFESRMAVEMTRLIERYGGHPSVAPALRERPIQDNPTALRFGVRLIEGQVDVLVLMTGVGTTALFDILKARHPMSSIMAGVKQVALVARGPKPAAALKVLGIAPTLVVPEPNTWVDVVSTLDEYRPVKGLRVAVQEYGSSNPEFLEALRVRGADVFPVPVYKWGLPEDLAPLRLVLADILAGTVAAMLITNAAQIDHVMQLLEQEGKVPLFREVCKTIVVASIGPVASERLRHYDLPVDFEPSHGKMGVMVKELSERIAPLLAAKRR